LLHSASGISFPFQLMIVTRASAERNYIFSMQVLLQMNHNQPWNNTGCSGGRALGFVFLSSHLQSRNSTAWTTSPKYFTGLSLRQWSFPLQSPKLLGLQAWPMGALLHSICKSIPGPKFNHSEAPIPSSTLSIWNGLPPYIVMFGVSSKDIFFTAILHN
jgi:hypothetical protein